MIQFVMSEERALGGRWDRGSSLVTEYKHYISGALWSHVTIILHITLSNSDQVSSPLGVNARLIC